MFRLFLATAVLSALPSATGAQPVTANAVRIHHLSSMTGVSGPANKEMLAGAQLYIDQVNKKGGINGRTIEIVPVDDKQDPKLTEQLAKELIDNKQVLAFFAPRTSSSTLAIHKQTEVAGIPLIASQPGTDFLYAPNQRTAFAVRASYSAEVDRAIELQHRLGRRSFGFIASNDGFGNPLVASATKKLADYSLKPAVVEKLDAREPNVVAALDSFVKSKPDVIVLLCPIKCAADFANGFMQRGGITQFIAISIHSSNGFVKALGTNARGVVVMQAAPPPTSRVIRVSKDYATASAAAKVEPSYAGMSGYVGARVVVEGIRRAGRNLTPASLIASLESMRNFDLGDFVINYGSGNRVGTAYIDETIITRDGKFLR